MKLSLSFVLALSLFGATAHAQTPNASKVLPPSNEEQGQVGPKTSFISPDDLSAFEEARSLVCIARLWNKPIDWMEAGSTLDQVIVHIKASLGNEAPLIEERNANTSRSTFALQGAPLGPTLSALAELANAKVWVFPGRLLIAPETALSPQEKTALTQKRGNEWQESRLGDGKSWNPFSSLQRIIILSVGGEIKSRLAAKGVPVPIEPVAPTTPNNATTIRPNEPVPLPHEIAFDELSPTAQAMVQELINTGYSNSISPNVPRPTTSTLVGFDDLSRFNIQMRLDNIQEGAPGGRLTIGTWYLKKPPTQ